MKLPDMPRAFRIHEYDEGRDYGPEFAGRCQHQFFDGSFCDSSKESHETALSDINKAKESR
jgi:hypothetical protein